MTFEPDSTGLKYGRGLPFSYQDFSIFNNIADSLQCDSFSFTIDPSAALNMTVTLDTAIIRQLAIPPLTYETIRLFFATTAPVFSDTMRFSGSIHLHTRNRKIDSTFAMPVNFIFLPLAKSTVPTRGFLNEQLLVHPNPTTGSVHATCSLGKSSFLYLHIFNNLGKDIVTVYDGVLSEGKHDFRAKLPPGMYYVRMETDEGIVTKKVIVE
ncbi:MAG: T9SS type A sorting domain-containing protein [Bacteroidota bacterium]|nr:T9SS type A sorting domain-containing protein [Bacteroidota bacterium]